MHPGHAEGVLGVGAADRGRRDSRGRDSTRVGEGGGHQARGVGELGEGVVSIRSGLWGGNLRLHLWGHHLRGHYLWGHHLRGHHTRGGEIVA